MTEIDFNEFDELKALLDSPAWPEAIKPKLICDTACETQKFERAEGILNWVVHKDLTGLNFLDLGCGEGHVAVKAKQNGANVSVGYDIKKLNWADVVGDTGTNLTNDWQAVYDNGPYDVVLLYDVLDHVQATSAKELLSKVMTVLKPKGTVFCRFHPWVSRHATHMYSKINKAYMHLVFTMPELKHMGLEWTPVTDHVIHPIKTYEDIYIKPLGFKIRDKFIETVEPENFFRDSATVTRRLRRFWKDKSHIPDLKAGGYPGQQIRQQFLDYTLVL